MLKKNELMTYVVMMLFAFCGINTCYAGVMDEEVINMQHIGNHGTHFNIPMPAETPDVYFNNVSQTIIINGTGEVEYYDVEIMSLTTFDTVISTQVNGYYDTIDVSSLPEGEYAITIDAPTGNSFEGFFSTY